MVQTINLTKFQVEQLEYFADLLESVVLSEGGVEAKVLMLFVGVNRAASSGLRAFIDGSSSAGVSLP